MIRRRAPKQLEFWQAPEKFRLYRGGVGSGKTFAGCVECFRQPPRSRGMVVAPTYPMLMDSTFETFVRLAHHAGILRQSRESKPFARLDGNRQVLFRTADKPERLRGPNLGWFWPDEAALCHPLTFQILLGRIRRPPYRGWLTTSPRGNRNWTHTTFSKGGADYRTIVASTRDAFWHPAEFVGSMEANYSHDFARQEIDGEVLDDAQEGLLPLWWLDRIESIDRSARANGGLRRLSCDLGYGTGRDSFTAIVRDDLGILYAFESAYVGVPEAAQKVNDLSRKWNVRHDRIVYDAAGPGRDMARYLEPYGINQALGYFGGGKGGPKAENKRSKMAWRLRHRLDPTGPVELPDDDTPTRGYHPLWVRPDVPDFAPQPAFTLPADRPWWPRLKEELAELKFTTKAKKLCLEPKEELAARLKRSPDLCDALLMSFAVED